MIEFQKPGPKQIAPKHEDELAETMAGIQRKRVLKP
jgi:hypothetical protein